MKNLKKWMAGALALTLCFGTLAGCADTTDKATPTTTVEATQDTTEKPTTGKITAYSEAPFITKLGTYGKVEDRLPDPEDIMIEADDYLKIGTYGGELKRAATSSSWFPGKIIEEGLFRFNLDGSVGPNVAKGYDVNEDSTVYTIYLRKGMKWSDGEPFTADDCVWFYNVVLANKLDSKGYRKCHLDGNGNPAVVEKVDDYTFTFTFGVPKYNFIQAHCVDMKWAYAPKHYFESAVDKILAGNKDEGLAEINEKAGTDFVDVGTMGSKLLYNFWNYHIPTLNPYVISNEAGKNSIEGDYFEFVRNPYYWKVDAVGQQLPYIDKITYAKVSSDDQKVLLLMDGTIDMSLVGIADVPTLLESDAGPRIYEWTDVNWGDVKTQVMFNLGIEDPHLNELFNNPDFRQAMSICVDREEVAQLYSNGWQKPGQCAPGEGVPGHRDSWSKKWTEYDVDKAKSLFESAGLVMGKDGFYDFADGTDFVLNIMSVSSYKAGEFYKILEPYYRAAGIKCTFKDIDRTNFDNEVRSNSIECCLHSCSPFGTVSVGLRSNSIVPGLDTNNVWCGTMDKSTATGDLLKLIELHEQLKESGDEEERNAIMEQMYDLYEKNMWVLAYVETAPSYNAINKRVKNVPETMINNDVYRNEGVAHVQCWYIEE